MDDKMAQWTMAASMLGVNRRLEAWRWPGGSVRMPRVAGYDVVRVILGLVLLTAAGLKGYQLATEPTLEKGLFTSRWFLIGQVEFELALGIFLLSGLYKRLVWLVTLVCFVGFSCVTLYKGLSGEASCGCFGKVEISPWYTLAFDICAVLAMLAFRPGRIDTRPMRPGWGRLVVFGALALATSISGGWTMAGYRPASLTEGGLIAGNDKFVVLEPKTWVGKPFPLLSYIDVGGKLSKGKWIVVLYHHDCPECVKTVPEFVRLAHTVDSSSDAFKFAFVEMPPFGGGNGLGLCPGSTYLIGQLRGDYQWLATTPIVVLIKNGIGKAHWECPLPAPRVIAQEVQRSSGVPSMHQ